MTVNPATAPLSIVNPLSRRGFATLFATHPPLAERVRRLRALSHDRALGNDRVIRLRRVTLNAWRRRGRAARLPRWS